MISNSDPKPLRTQRHLGAQCKRTLTVALLVAPAQHESTRHRTSKSEAPGCRHTSTWDGTCTP